MNLGLPMCLTMHNVYELKYMVYFVCMFISFRYGVCVNECFMVLCLTVIVYVINCVSLNVCMLHVFVSDQYSVCLYSFVSMYG